MANFATLLHGDLTDVLYELEAGDCDVRDVSAAVCNTIRKVLAMQRLKGAIAQEDFDLTAPPPATYTAAQYAQEQIASANSTMPDEEVFDE